MAGPVGMMVGSMCLLALIRRSDPDFPLVLASNRDERRDRKSSPPGLFVGENRRILSPRDRLGGGTWIGLSDSGMVAGLTNRAGMAELPVDSTRGELVHLALDQGDVMAAVDAVRHRTADERFNPFQMMVADRERCFVVQAGQGVLDATEVVDRVVVLTNEHSVGELLLPGQDRWPALSLDALLERLRAALLDTGGESGHRVLKDGGEWGTVSSSILAVPAGDLREVLWLFAAGAPDVAPYRNYGNLGKRLSS